MRTTRANAIPREEAHTSGLYTKRPVAIVRGDGALLYDEGGREYIDCVGGQ
ncbi:MAG: aspartate aminotransferase family protein, partial [Chloroflexota bacterium]